MGLGAPPPQGGREQLLRTRHTQGRDRAFPEAAPGTDPFEHAAPTDPPPPSPQPDELVGPGAPVPKVALQAGKPDDQVPHPIVADLQGLADAICRCIGECCAALPKRIAKEMEQMLLTSRGPMVRPPPTCAQPVLSDDVDDNVLGFDLPSSDADGESRTVLKRIARRDVVLKGINWEFAADKSVARPADPGDQLAVDVLVDGHQVGTHAEQLEAGDDVSSFPTGGKRSSAAYFNTSRPPAPGGIDALAASQIHLQQGSTIELRARRVTPPTGQQRISYKISARWKGWEWDPTASGDGIGGAAAF